MFADRNKKYVVHRGVAVHLTQVNEKLYLAVSKMVKDALPTFVAEDRSIRKVVIGFQNYTDTLTNTRISSVVDASGDF